MTKDDLKQISELLDEKLDTKLEKAFDKLSVKMDEKLEKAISEIATAMNTAFAEHEEKNDERFAQMDRRFDKIEEELAQKPSSEKIFNWADNILIPVSRDVDRLKYINIKKLKNLPDNLTISSALIEEGL